MFRLKFRDGEYLVLSVSQYKVLRETLGNKKFYECFSEERAIPSYYDDEEFLIEVMQDKNYPD